MKTLLVSFSLLICSLVVNAQSSEGNTITVTIENAKNDQGSILVSLHNSETFMKGAGLQSAKGHIKDGKSTITLENVVPGEYAIMVLHDANDNQQMDFEPNGMPKESYGLSNNVMSFGPPSYADAKFNMGNEDLEMPIRF